MDELAQETRRGEEGGEEGMGAGGLVEVLWKKRSDV